MIAPNKSDHFPLSSKKIPIAPTTSRIKSFIGSCLVRPAPFSVDSQHHTILPGETSSSCPSPSLTHFIPPLGSPSADCFSSILLLRAGSLCFSSATALVPFCIRVPHKGSSSDLLVHHSVPNSTSLITTSNVTIKWKKGGSESHVSVSTLGPECQKSS